MKVEREKILERFGKHTKSKACIYVNKLADIDTNVLEELIQYTLDEYQTQNQRNKNGMKSE
ncbi:hypothetical protein [Paenibacillus camelliae]|uniref:hypothetical protein n=1 Tax=Paenibacillus camelliae TaxID=512410 RepID=UPI003D8186A0